MSILLKHGGKTAAYKTLSAAKKGLLAVAEGVKAGERAEAELFFEAGRYTLDAPFTLSREETPALSSLCITLSGEDADRILGSKRFANGREAFDYAVKCYRDILDKVSV